MPNWQSYHSIPAKNEFLERWPACIPPIVWYDLGENFNEADMPLLVPVLLGYFRSMHSNCMPELSTHPSMNLPGHTLLKVEHIEQFVYELKVWERVCPLVQAGGSREVVGDQGYAVNFATLWEDDHP